MPMVRCGNTPPEVGTAICIASTNGNNSGKAVRITQGGTFSIYAYGKRYGGYDPYVSVRVNGVTKWSWHPSTEDGIEQTRSTIVLQEGDLVACTSSTPNNVGMMNCAVICYKDIV